MRKRLVRAVILIAIASGIAIGVADAAGAVEGFHFGGGATVDGSTWT
jgi:hypothetical protein